MSRLRKFYALERSEKLLFCESLLLHLYAGLLLKVVPFRKIPSLFKSRQLAAGNRQSEVVEKVRVAVQRAGWVSPWRNRCLVSSLAARCMLNRRKTPSSLSLGLTKKQDGTTIAHAWLNSCGREIVEKRGDYIELYTF